MNALDTNILVRLFINDPTDKEAQAQRLIAEELFLQPSFIALTVILEFVWVISKGYLLPRAGVVEILQNLCDLPDIFIEDIEMVKIATSLYAQGMDFTDAIHLLKTQHCDNFYTFDKKFIKKSKTLSLHLTAKEPT
ncbi:type II toxin-antitoxin system VapC family toxin [Faucicola mancuniensis]|uniref:type II toxin-antitoxin system VapC family toxin n=1 Tax=Faucicola mancuniensis TaxID=1309795 RepID=UPI00397747A0